MRFNNLQVLCQPAEQTSGQKDKLNHEALGWLIEDPENSRWAVLMFGSQGPVFSLCFPFFGAGVHSPAAALLFYIYKMRSRKS